MIKSFHSNELYSLTILQLLFSWAGSHLIRVGGGLLVIALVVSSIFIVASLLAIVRLVTPLGASVGVLLSIASLAEGIRGRLLLLRRHIRSSESSH